MKTSIIIPNWNGLNLLKSNFPFVIKASRENQVIIVDDASTDGSVDYIRSHFPHVSVISKARHEGFSSTVNLGVMHAQGDIVLLLNTDIRPHDDILKYLLPHFSDKKVFAVGCMDKSIEGGNIVLRGRGVAQWKQGFYIHARGDVDKPNTAWVSGGSGAFRKNLWNQLGGMDPVYNPFYWEDIDLSYRARKAGYKIIFESHALVEHMHEEGVIKQNVPKNVVLYTSYRNQFIFIWKNCTDAKIIMSHIFWTPVRLLQSLIVGNPWMLIGYIFACIRIPNIIFMRRKHRKYWNLEDNYLNVY